MRPFFIFFFAMAFLFATPLEAGMAVRPTKLFMVAPGAAATLLVDNHTDTENVYQVGAAAWLDRSDPGKVGPTRELIISPQVFRLAPGQVGRVTIRAARAGIAGSGKAYRVLVRQVAPQRSPGDLSVHFQVQFSIPLLTKVEP
jgi:P pilus assembly chaperone PapD